MMDYVRIFDNVFELNTLSSLLKYLNKIEFSPASISNKYETSTIDKNIRDVDGYFFRNISNSMAEVFWANYFKNKSNELYNLYKKDFKACSIKKWEPFNVLKYNKNNFFKGHVDHGPNSPRTISLIYLLNNDYEGGDLIFFDETKEDQEYIVEKKANRAILFPSNFVFKHTVTPVKKGTRFSVVGWAL